MISGENVSLEYTEILELDLKTHNKFAVKVSDKTSIGFAVFQVHCYHFNVTLSLDRNLKMHENGTNLGFVLFDSHEFHLFNFNLNSVKCLIGVQTYDKEAPIPGACDIGTSLAISPTISVKLTRQFVEVSTKKANLPGDNYRHCDSHNDLLYETYFQYLGQDDFESDAYFDGIKKFLNGNLPAMGVKVIFTFKLL